MSKITRTTESRFVESLAFFPSVALLGPRQVGKTTLVRRLMDRLEKPARYFDLENPSDYAWVCNSRTLPENLKRGGWGVDRSYLEGYAEEKLRLFISVIITEVKVLINLKA